MRYESNTRENAAKAIRFFDPEPILQVGSNMKVLAKVATDSKEKEEVRAQVLRTLCDISIYFLLTPYLDPIVDIR